MIDYLFKRIVAYSLDMFLVSIVVSSIAANSTINFQLDDYEKYYNEYLEVSTIYLEQQANDIKTCEELNTAVDKDKLTEEKYVSEVSDLNKNKKSMTEEEYDSKCLLIVKKYNDNKMTDEEIIDKVNHLSYMTEKNSVIMYAVSVIACLLYFGLFQGFTYGQTLGKKIMRLKIVSNDGNKVSYKQLIFRTLFLYSIINYLGIILFALAFSEDLFISAVNILSIFNTTLLTIIGIMIIFNGRRGLHDVICKTKVILMDFKGNEINLDKKLFISEFGGNSSNENTANNTEESVDTLNKSNKKTKHKSKSKKENN